MIITRALPGDIDTIMSRRRQRVAWLAQLGQDQWSNPMPRTAVAATVMAGQTWIVRDGEHPVSTITLAAWPDTDDLWKPDQDPEALWLSADDPADALYAAKMIVPREHAGHHLGAHMLDWAGGRAFDAGVTWLRLDAWTTNSHLHDYYRDRGFQHIRTVRSRISGACFQRPAQPYTGNLLKTED
jgi:GNAT superfamily N-acetyltransferase